MSALPMMAAHAGGQSPLSAPAPFRRMLPIAQVLDRMPGLSRTHKAVLNQVCGLAENGQRKQCDATNPYLASRLGASERTISRTIIDLEGRQLLLVEGQGKARRIWPVEALRACYLTAMEAEQDRAILQLGKVANLDRNLDRNLDSNHANLDTNLDKADSQPRQNGQPNLDTLGSQPSQNGSRVYRDNQYNHSKPEEEEGPLRSALSAAEKKIGELESALEEMTYQRNQLRASLLAQRPDPASPSGADASASHTRGAAAGHKIPFGQSKVATPEGFTTLATALKYPAAYAPHYLAHMAVKAGTETRDERGWQNFVQRYLANDATSETGLITTPPNDSATPHAKPRNYSRPLSGAQQRLHPPKVEDYGSL